MGYNINKITEQRVPPYKALTFSRELVGMVHFVPDNFSGILVDDSESEYWYENGYWHRIGGAAIEYDDGSKEWWVYDKPVTEEQHNLLASIMKLKGLM